MDTFENKNILVVGGAGFVGSNLVLKLLESNPKSILIIDNLLSSEKENVPHHEAVTFIHGSITHDSILQQIPENLDYVFHLSTYHGNQSSIANPLADHENNTYTTLKLYHHLRTQENLKKVVYSSAGCVVAEKTFDTAKATTENTMPSLFLDSPYQISKLIGELYSNYYYQHHGLPVVKARFQNVYGPREILGAGQWRGTSHTIWRNVIPSFIYRGLKKMPLTIDNGGIATRDFIYAEDIAAGLMACALRGKPGENYNLASGEETCIKDLAELINELTNNPAPLELKPKREWDNSGKRYGSTDKAFKEIGFKANHSLKEGLEKTIHWTEQQMNLIERCIHQHREHMASLELA